MENEQRPRLTREDVALAAETYTTQAFKILDERETEVRNNLEWIDKLGASAIAELMAHMTVSRMLERNDFAQRFQYFRFAARFADLQRLIGKSEGDKVTVHLLERLPK